MIGTITGETLDGGKGVVIVETESGVGYVINVKIGTKNEILTKKKCKLFTHTTIRNDKIELFGFIEQEEYSTFLLLLNVSGIGPKKALQILESIPTKSLISAIQKEDADLLISFGINKKQAQKIILDLQKKIEVMENTNGVSQDIFIALLSLGYTKSEVASVLKETKIEGKTIQEQIQSALKAMRGV